MANRYWVGGAGTWDSSNTANWSAVSGGPGGESVPTTSDDVYLEGSTTVTLSGAIYCNNFSITNITTDGTGFDMYVAGTTFTTSGAVTWNAPGTIHMTSASSKTFNINGAGRIYNCGVDQAGAGTLNFPSTCSIYGLSSSYTASGAGPATINIAASISVAVFGPWTARGTAATPLTLTCSGTTAATAGYFQQTYTPTYPNVQFADYITLTGFVSIVGYQQQRLPIPLYLGTNVSIASDKTLVQTLTSTANKRMIIFRYTSVALNWTVPNNFNPSNNEIHIWGGGGGGGGARAYSTTDKAGGGGGGGGGYTKLTNLALTPGQIVTVAVGNGGGAGTTGNGGNGGNSNFAGYTAGGGAGGTRSTASGSRGLGGGGGTGTTANGGAGGNSGYSGVGLTYAVGGGGGGGAGGPYGTGGAGGAGNYSAGGRGGGGGGGNGGGSAGTTPATGALDNPGVGGNNAQGVGGGSYNTSTGILTAPFKGGGGSGYGGVSNGSFIYSGVDVANYIGGSGGQGGASSNTAPGSLNSIAGGGGGAGVNTSTTTGGATAGGQGAIVIIYTIATGEFFNA